SRRQGGREGGEEVRAAAAVVALVTAIAICTSVHAAGKFDAKTASFAVTFHDETSAYRDTALVSMPRATVVINAVGGPPGDYAATTRDGVLVQQGVRQWKWTAPERPGTYLITVEGPGKKDAIALHAFVMV